ncbi:unnamed protein product [Toxocara canis]|uniref:Uncharacterized protein n=1 Tax=Toxocara canis TaxID=6265 RepID=A0A3P7GP31_TOXCA|nr:unnamed protein product [Toxocara canis]
MSGHAQMSAMIDTRNSDCFSVKPTKYISNWASLNVAKRLRNYELRPIIDGDLPHLALSGIIECDRITSSQQLRRINVDIVEPWLYVGFGKTNNDTFKKQVYLFCQLTSSMLSAWIYCWYRIYITVRNSLADYEEWIDLAFAKVLADAARYKDELLMLLLLKYQARAVRNSDERNYWTQIRQAANNAGLTLKPIRKLAIVATLNEWQQFIAPHVKLADVLTARKYIGSHPEQGDLPADSNVKDSTRITLDKSPRVAPRGSSSTINVRPNDLILPVFFWSIFEKLKLHANNLNGTFLAEMSASFTLTIDNLKVSIVERNELDVPTRHSSSCTTRPLFTLESFRSDGHISHHFIMDEHRLRPIKACLEIYYNCEVPRLSADVSPSAWRFLDELRIVHKYCTQISTVFKKPIVSTNIDFTPPRTPSITEAKVTGTVSGAACNPIWTRSLHNAIRTYKLSKPDAATHTSKAGTLRLSVEGTVNLTAVYCFSTLDNVNVLLELSGAKVRHKSVHDDSPTERQSSDVLYTVLNAIHIELTTGVKIGVGTIAESIYKKLQCSFRREYDGKAFKKVVDLKLDDAFLSTTVDTHRIAAIFAKCLIKWVKEAGSDWNDVLRATYSEDVKSEQAQLQVCFALKVLRVQISAKISSTILLQYDMEDIRIAAELPKKFEVLLSKHSLSFTMSPVKNVQEQNRPSKCALTLPPVCVRHEIRNTDEEECLIIGGENLRYKDGLHSNIIVSIGKTLQFV